MLWSKCNEQKSCIFSSVLKLLYGYNCCLLSSLFSSTETFQRQPTTFVIVTLALLFKENIVTAPLVTATNYDLNSVLQFS
jgi:hypothetical protein